MIAFGTRSWIVCRTMEKYELMSARMSDVSISSRSVRPFVGSWSAVCGDACSTRQPPARTTQIESTHCLQVLVKALHVERGRVPLEASSKIGRASCRERVS